MTVAYRRAPDTESTVRFASKSEEGLYWSSTQRRRYIQCLCTRTPHTPAAGVVDVGVCGGPVLYSSFACL